MILTLAPAWQSKRCRDCPTSRRSSFGTPRADVAATVLAHVGSRSLRQVAPRTCRRSEPQRRSQAVLWSTCGRGRRRLCAVRRSGPRSRTPLRLPTVGRPQRCGPVVHMAQFSPDNLKTARPLRTLRGTHASRTAKAAMKRIMQAPRPPRTYRSPAGRRPDHSGATAGSQQAPRRVPQARRRVEHEVERRVRGDRTEQSCLVDQPGEVSQAVPPSSRVKATSVSTRPEGCTAAPCELSISAAVQPPGRYASPCAPGRPARVQRLQGPFTTNQG